MFDTEQVTRLVISEQSRKVRVQATAAEAEAEEEETTNATTEATERPQGTIHKMWIVY